RDLAALSARQVWLDSLLEDRWTAQEIMDEQGRQMEELRKRFEELGRDRAKAQLVMDGQHEQLRYWVSESESRKQQIDQLKKQLREQKQILSAAKSACRKGGKCFRPEGGPKTKKSLTTRITRELRRIPANLGLGRGRRDDSPPATEKKTPAAKPSKPVDRYLAWQEEHEPNDSALAEQRRLAALWQDPPTISFCLPVKDPPAKFLDELLDSIAAQSAPNWEVCLVDGGSALTETLETIKNWSAREPRIRVERLEENLGISENTNRALAMATGDFVACIDHDDLLAPFAVYELTRAILHSPETEIFYSDEDRCDLEGRRHSPFFKPEWSPELLLSSMYIGHLTAYRRSLVERVGRFRKEFDLSQDYDFALRATEQARGIEHLPHVLYHWREHPASGSAGGKPEARVTNLAALAAAMERRNLPAEIVEYPTANRARLKAAIWPRVSIIIPTDSPTRAQSCLERLPRQTRYPDLEIVIVTNSALIEPLQLLQPESATLLCVAYDKPFNFSDKCNVGAEAATGERFVFFNDDVESVQADWLQNLIEPLENPEVGAVAPKLLYETGLIQHAGLVTGVRGLIGTAFHQRAADSTEHFNMAQSLRNVAALSAACLAVRREDFFRVGGFDAVNTPIGHSDVDLSFKIREAGLRCVYTPFATLYHAGHVSIGSEEKSPEPDKSSIYLLKRWPEFTTHDPFFPDNMRDWLHTDSPTPIRMTAANRSDAVSAAPDLLFVSHDLSLSGAPIMLFHAARWCRENGIFVVVVAPNDGPLREKLHDLGVPVVIDPLVASGHPSFAQFARNFDCVIANSIRSKAVAPALKKEKVPVLWWIHEPGSVGEHYLREDAELRAAFPLAEFILAPSERTARIYRPFTDRPVKALHNAIPDLGVSPSQPAVGQRLRFVLLASIEPRKGQDIFVEALASLPPELLERAEFQLGGRILDPDFWLKVDRIATRLKNISVMGALDHADAIGLMRNADVIVSPSRDEALPVVILEALSLGKALVATTVGGVLEILVDGEDALLVRPESPEALAGALRRLLENPDLIPQLGARARETYERQFTLDRFGRDFRALVEEAISLAAHRSAVAG
ncbi:MAG TPA: glycosyltransferase, partial [Chthoniobacterales bacterium]